MSNETLKPLGFVDTSDSVPWREAFPEYKDEDLPGVCLRGSRHKEGITQKQLSELTGIPQRHISMMENGKHPIISFGWETRIRTLIHGVRVRCPTIERSPTISNQHHL